MQFTDLSLGLTMIESDGVRDDIGAGMCKLSVQLRDLFHVLEDLLGANSNFEWLPFLNNHSLHVRRTSRSTVPGSRDLDNGISNLALFENRVIRLCMVMIGTALATDDLRATVN